MNEPAIVFDGVWKKFHRGEMHDSLRDLIPALCKRLLGRGPERSRLEEGDFWALSDVSFHVGRGEALGIIGPNGAGKSTILKVLSRIMRPNRGRAEVRGRAGALIEVAAGFHPDLTGRENIFLQGSIMGMRKDEITAKFDEIVEFAGLPEFIDTQVKRYSSGMSARLGFSIAAHLDPEVLIIDEVLSVGDFAFQRKAFQRMNEIVQRDIPVVIVSHQLDRIASLCTKAILLDRGRVSQQGSPAECISAYLNGQSANGVETANSPIHITRTAILSDQPVASGDWLEFELRGSIRPSAELDALCLAFRVRSSASGQIVFASDGDRCGVTLPAVGPFALRVAIQMNVAPGIYALEPTVWDQVSRKNRCGGPGTFLQVKDGPSFFGVAQLHAKMEFLPVGQVAVSD